MARFSRPAFTLLAAAAVLACPPPARANVNELFTELFGRAREPRVRAGYEFRQWGDRAIKSDGANLEQRQQLFDLSVPIAGTDTARWRLDANARLDEARTSATFAGGRTIPKRLWDLSVGVSHSAQLPDDRALALSFAVGSNGDEPFRRGRDITLQGNFLYKRPAPGPEAAWLFALNFSNNRNFANYIPIPGVAYYFRPVESLRLALGVPFLSAFWNPVPKAILNLSYFPLNNVQARFSYFFFGPAQAYAQLRYQTKNYLPSDRTITRERFFYEEAVAQLGVTSPLSRSLMIDLFGGYSFDRKFFYGRRTLDKTRSQVLRPENSAFGSLRLIASF